MAELDDHARKVFTFRSDITNLSRIAELVDVIYEMAVTDDWRDYTTAVGRQQWRAAEFDYFLIDCGLAYSDASKVIAWSRKGKEIGELMNRNASKRDRRPIETVGDTWATAGFESFTDLAARLGWIDPKTETVLSPVPRTARTEVERATARPQQFQVTWTNTEQLAERLLARITADPDVEDIVYRALHSRRVVNNRRKSAGQSVRVHGHNTSA